MLMENNMKKIMILCIIMITAILSGNHISLNFFINPSFAVEKLETTAKDICAAVQDSVYSINIMAGDLFYESITDSIALDYMSLLPGSLYTPDDYLHYYPLGERNYELLAANIKSDSAAVQGNYQIHSDSLQVGIFAIYTPDLAVKKKFAEGVELNADILSSAQKQITKLQQDGCEHIIMLTSISRYVMSYLLDSLAVDTVISFDYKKVKDKKYKGKSDTDFYWVDSSKGKYGKLKLDYSKGRISSSWQELSYKNAAGNK